MHVASRTAGVAARTALSATDFRGVRIQLITDAAAAVLVLLVATVLSLFKPQGMTPYGRKQERQRTVSQRPYGDTARTP